MTLADGSHSFTISEIAQEFGVTARALRFYEDRGLISPGRRGQTRIYSSRDRARLRLVLLGKSVGLALDDIRTLLDLYDLKDGQRTQLRAALDTFRAQAARLAQQRLDIEVALTSLHEAIAWTETCLGKLPEQSADAPKRPQPSATIKPALKDPAGAAHPPRRRRHAGPS